MKGPEESPDPSVADRISAEIASTHCASYGEAVERVETHILEDAVLCVLDVNLLPHEKTLLDGGHGADSIRQIRSLFQSAIGSTFIATIEHQTGRRVQSFVSQTNLDPPYEIEFFRLSPTQTIE